MTPGTVLHHSRFEFFDVGYGKKYLVVLNDGISGYYVVAKTTSNPKNKTASFGCNSKDKYPNFFIPDGRGCLIGDSWVGLNEFYELPVPLVIAGGMSGIIQKMGCLASDVCALLLACALGCDDITLGQIAVLRDVVDRLFSSGS